MTDLPDANASTAISHLFGDGGRPLDPPGSIRLAPLYRFPTPHRVFPQAKQLMNEARTWLLKYVERVGGGKRLERPIDETLSMCPYLFPDGDYEGIFLTTVFLTLGFVNDDIFDSLETYEALCASPRGQRMAEELRTIRSNPRLLAQGMLTGVRILQDPAFQPAGLGSEQAGILFFHDALRDFSTRLHDDGRRSGSPHFRVWLERFLKSLIDFSKSHANIYRDIENLTVEEYAEHKLINCGMLHTVYLLELALSCFLSEKHHEHPGIKQFKRHCMHVGSLLNEIISYEKEVFREKSGNLLLVIMLKEKANLEEATRRVAALAQGHSDDILRLRDELLAEFAGDDEESQLVRRYVSGLEMLTAACWAWQIEGTTRYRSPTSPFAELLAV